MSASWTLVPCLVSLRTEFNKLAPSRDKASDGSVGDTSHAASSSDHNPDETGRTPYSDADDLNEVHAIDVTARLNRAGWTMKRAVDIIVARHRSGADNRLQNIIYNRKIISRSWGWQEWRDYGGASPHTEHAHFSARYTTPQENDTDPWGLLAAAEAEEDHVDAADRTAIAKEAAALVVKELGPKIDACVSWGDPAANNVVESRVFGQVVTDLERVRAALKFAADHPEAVDAGFGPATPLGQLLGVPEALDHLAATVERIEAALTGK